MLLSKPHSIEFLVNQKTAVLQLIAATVLWGFGFVATVWAIGAYTPVEALSYRFFLAALLGLLIEGLRRGPRELFSRQDILLSLPAGLLLGLMQLTQSIGLRTTTATKSGFITSLYVILVPLIGTLFLKKNSPFRTYILAAVALAGTYLLIGGRMDSFVIGDLWTFLCAICAAVHIIYIGKIAKNVDHAFRFNTYQSLWGFITLSPLLLFQSHVTVYTTDIRSIAGVLCLCIGSSTVAFFLQIKAQRHLSNTTTTMLSLLESPLAAFFGFILLQETLNWSQAFGALIILATSALHVLMDPSEEAVADPQAQAGLERL